MQTHKHTHTQRQKKKTEKHTQTLKHNHKTHQENHDLAWPALPQCALDRTEMQGAIPTLPVGWRPLLHLLAKAPWLLSGSFSFFRSFGLAWLERQKKLWKLTPTRLNLPCYNSSITKWMDGRSGRAGGWMGDPAGQWVGGLVGGWGAAAYLHLSRCKAAHPVSVHPDASSLLPTHQPLNQPGRPPTQAQKKALAASSRNEIGRNQVKEDAESHPELGQ